MRWKKPRFEARVCVLQEFRDKEAEVWKVSKVQFVYDTSETSHFINAYNRESPAEYSSNSAHFRPACFHRNHSSHSPHISIQMELQADSCRDFRFSPTYTIQLWFSLIQIMIEFKFLTCPFLL